MEIPAHSALQRFVEEELHSAEQDPAMADDASGDDDEVPSRRRRNALLLIQECLPIFVSYGDSWLCEAWYEDLEDMINPNNVRPGATWSALMEHYPDLVLY